MLSDDSAAVSFSPLEVLTISRSELTDLLKREERWVIHGAKYWIRSGVLSRVAVDTEIASYLLNPGSRDLELVDVLRKFCGIELPVMGQDLFTEDWNPAAAAHLLTLWDYLNKELERHNALRLYQELEIPTMEILSRMESLGIGVEKKKLSELRTYFETEENLQIKKAYDSVGHEFNVASPKQLQSVLLEEF